MGAAQAELFASEGASVCVADLNEENGNGIVEKIRKNHGRAMFARLDVTKSEQWAKVVGSVEKEFGPITILCNNAGANFRVGFDEQTEEMWHIVMDTALTGAFLGIKACVPSLRRAQNAAIVNMGSLASTRPGGGSPAYAASKSGMVGLTISAAKSYAKDGIRCNMVSPGHVDTPFIRGNNPHSPNDWSTSIENPDNFQRRLAATPLGRLQTPVDIARAFLFLASDEASMITGVNLKVDGGAGI
jgi:NAD(P)-dependent dehydrogenase (short-subunit alcohol dehydrogenase family)